MEREESLAAEGKKSRKSQSNAPTLSSDTPYMQTLVNWVEFDMYVCLQQRQRKELHWELLLLIICLHVSVCCVCFSVHSLQITGLWKEEKLRCNIVNINLNNDTMEPVSPHGNCMLSSVHAVWCTNTALASVFWSSVLMYCKLWGYCDQEWVLCQKKNR